MKLRLHYDPECDAIGLDYNLPHRATHEVEGLGWVMIDLPDDESHKAVGLEVLGISAWLPLGKLGYCKETDTLTFGNPSEAPAVSAQNGDLVAHWRRDASSAGGLTAIAVDLRNASQHLAPITNATSKSPTVQEA